MKKVLPILAILIAALVLFDGCAGGVKDMKGRKKKKVSMGWI